MDIFIRNKVDGEHLHKLNHRRMHLQVLCRRTIESIRERNTGGNPAGKDIPEKYSQLA